MKINSKDTQEKNWDKSIVNWLISQKLTNIDNFYKPKL